MAWIFCGYAGYPVSTTYPGKVSVLLTYFNPQRLKDIDSQIRNILKCTFVAEVIVSSHNPDLPIRNLVKVRDQRLKILSQKTKRACGYRWRIAAGMSCEHLIVIDDDVLLFPKQIKILFEGMLKQPNVPHGLAGMLLKKEGGYEYFEQKDMRVSYLCEVYGVTDSHVARYFEMERMLAEQDKSLPDAVERLGDYILISRTADENPVIHDVGRIFRSETFNSEGVANHKEGEFLQVLSDITCAVQKLKKTV